MEVIVLLDDSGVEPLSSDPVLESLSQAAQSKAAIHKAILLLCFLIDMV